MPHNPPASATPPESGSRRSDQMRRSIRDDMRRYRQREPAGQSFWRSLSVVGGVGWPIALSTVAGALLGRQLDHYLNTGIRMTLLLLMLGALLGGSIAWSVIQGTRR